jgi:CRISPR-associated protein Cmr3
MIMQTLIFSAVDTLFFKESRPMESPGSSELGSIFPPPARTVMGAIRTLIGESQQLDWQDKTHKPEIWKTIGNAADFGGLGLNGVWLHYKGQRLYPTPLNVLAKQAPNANKAFIYLQIGQAVECDLGKQVRLPELPAGEHGYKALQHYWLTKQGLKKVLSGEAINDDENHLISIDQLRDEEHRLGIARDNQARRVKTGLLYQTRHIRLKKEACFSVDLNGWNENLPEGLVKLGGEGRMATLEITDKPTLPDADQQEGDQLLGIIIYLLTPLRLKDEGSECLPDFEKNEDPNLTYWKGEIAGIPLKLISSVIGKAQREGGWDMAGNKPRNVNNLIPAGSAFYCEVPENTIAEAINTLHDTQIGEEQALGRGHIAVGVWKKEDKSA